MCDAHLMINMMINIFFYPHYSVCDPRLSLLHTIQTLFLSRNYNQFLTDCSKKFMRRVSQSFISMELISATNLVRNVVILLLFCGQETEVQKSNPCNSWWQISEYKALVSFSLQNSTSVKCYMSPVPVQVWFKCLVQTYVDTVVRTGLDISCHSNM